MVIGRKLVGAASIITYEVSGWFSEYYCPYAEAFFSPEVTVYPPMNQNRYSLRALDISHSAVAST
jgi:hypothetical protein